MRSDTNKISLRAIRNLLAAAAPFELDIGATKVSCSVSPAEETSWPTDITGLDESEDGPWPRGVVVDCRWHEGSCRLHVGVFYWGSGPYLHDLCIHVQTERREIVFVNVSNEIEQAEDGSQSKLGVRFFVTKRKTDASADIADALNRGLREVLAESGIPILGKNRAELGEVAVPSGDLVPSPDIVYRRLIHLALLKLDFLDRRRTAEGGPPPHRHHPVAHRRAAAGRRHR